MARTVSASLRRPRRAAARVAYDAYTRIPSFLQKIHRIVELINHRTWYTPDDTSKQWGDSLGTTQKCAADRMRDERSKSQARPRARASTRHCTLSSLSISHTAGSLRTRSTSLLILQMKSVLCAWWRTFSSARALGDMSEGADVGGCGTWLARCCACDRSISTTDDEVGKTSGGGLLAPLRRMRQPQ